MDASITDLLFYLGDSSSELALLDVPLLNGQIVSINLDEELPDDLDELVAFLETEKAPVKYWVTVGQAYCRKDKYDEAAKLAELALALSAVGVKDKAKVHGFLGWLWLARAHSANGKPRNTYLSNATDEIARALKEDSLSVPNLLARATLAIYRDQAERALEIFDRLLKVEPTNCFALLGKAQIVLKRTKNYQQALKLFQQVLLLNPGMQPDPRIGVGLCFYLLKDEKMAITSWERALELDSGNIKARLLLVLIKFNQAFNHAPSDVDFVSEYEAALKELVALHKNAPNDGVILIAIVSYFYLRGDFEKARQVCSKISSIYTSKSSKFEKSILSQALTWQGRIIFAEGDYTGSQKQFHEAIKLDESNLLAKLVLGYLQILRGSTEEAIITFELIIKTDPKCLEVIYSLAILYSKQKSRSKQEQAIQLLERYIRVSARRDVEGAVPEPVFINAFLVLLKMYESRDLNQSLQYLEKAIEATQLVKKDAPVEVYNNIGVIHFIKQQFEALTEFFLIALDKLSSFDGKDEKAAKLKDIATTIRYNIARSKENADETSSIEIYEDLQRENPDYFSAKLRLLFLQCTLKDSKKEDLKAEVDLLLALAALDLEVRAFYGWFIHTFGNKLGVKSEEDTKHQKDTLVEHDLHDCYALLLLANIYCIMAREIKVTNSQQDEKQRKYYTRATELFAKVLSVDSKNVYAAQGLAIVYIETKDLHKGIDILRKIRDSLNDVTVYTNLGHALLELKQYAKSIESYEIALLRFRQGKDVKLLLYLGKSWLSRGIQEQSLTCLKRALEYLEEVLGLSEELQKPLQLLKFNVAYVQFQIAEFVSKLSVDQRNVDDIKFATLGLNEAISTLESLVADGSPEPPYPKADIVARISLGRNTLLNRLNVSLEETNENLAKFEERLEEAKRVREAEEEVLRREEEVRKENLKRVEEQMAKERAVLQAEAQQWAEEARANAEKEDAKNKVDEDDDFEVEDDAKSKSKLKKAGKGKGKKRKAVISDSESEEQEQPNDEPEEPEEPEAELLEEEKTSESAPKRKKRRTAISDDEDEMEVENDDEKKEGDGEKENGEKEDEDNDDLFGEEE